jgi:predicted phosphodiesterase
MELPPRLKVVKHDLGVDTDAVYIIPLSDLHIGADFDEDKFLGYRQWILDRPNAYCVINGDVLDMATKSSIGGQYETLRPREQRQLAVKFLEPLARAGKILAYLDGNHEARASKDTDEYAGETICAMLGIPSVYHSDGIFLFLSVGADKKQGYKNKEKNRITYGVFMLHGWAGARRIGGKANNLEDMAKSVIADVYIASHTHQKLAFPRRIIEPETRTKTLRYKKQVFVSAGSFLEWSGYSVRKGYSPASLGSPRIRLAGDRKDVHVSL